MTRKERLAYIDKALASHERALEELKRDLRRVPYVAFALLLAIPAGLWWGFIGALTAVGAVVGSGVGAFYIVLGHRKERERKMAALRDEAETLRAPPDRGPSAPPS